MEQVRQAAFLLGQGGLLPGSGNFQKAGEGAHQAGRLARRCIFFNQARPPVGDDVFPVDLVELEAERIEHRVGPRGEEQRVFGSHTVQLGTGRITLLPQSCDEHLSQRDPLPLRHHLRAGREVIEHILDRIHLRDRVVELNDTRRLWMRMAVNQPGQDHLSGEINGLRPGTLERQNFGI